jgi:transcriptional regulator with XRE-family HTH domain
MSPPLPNSLTGVLARRLPEVRKARHVSQAALADQLRDTHGVDADRAQLANLEAGRRQTAPVELVAALALALDVSPDVLVLPTDNREVALTPAVVVGADQARAWFTGRSLLLAAAGEGRPSWPPEGSDDFDARREFWRGQRPDRERRAYARPGVAHLQAEVDRLVDAAGSSGVDVRPHAMRSALEAIRREAERQLDALDSEDGAAEG